MRREVLRGGKQEIGVVGLFERSVSYRRDAKILLFSVLASIICSKSSATEQLPSPEDMKFSADKSERYSDGLRRWTPEVSVAVRYFNRDAVQFSPDEKYFFVYSWRGDLVCDCNPAELSVYSVAEVLQAISNHDAGGSARPMRVLVRKSGGFNPSNRTQRPGTIVGPRWESDSRSIVYNGLDETNRQQLYQFDIASGALKQLTRFKSDTFSIAKVGKVVFGQVLVPDPQGSQPEYPYHPISPATVIDSLSDMSAYMSLSFSYDGAATWMPPGLSAEFAFPTLSADQSRAIFLAAPRTRAEFGRPNAPDRRGSSQFAQQFQLVDLKRRTVVSMVGAAQGASTEIGLSAARRGVVSEALWSKDQRHAILVNTALPASEGRSDMAYIIGFDTATNQRAIIEPVQAEDPSGGSRLVTKVKWLPGESELAIEHSLNGSAAPTLVYAWKNGRWEAGSGQVSDSKPIDKPRVDEAPPQRSLSVKVVQSGDRPPVAVASSRSGEIVLSNSDVALEGVWRAKETPFQWQLPDGSSLVAGLLLPREIKERVPIVLQIYSYSPETFSPDGPSRHIYAAQALAAEGIAVLNVSLPESNEPNASYLHKPVVDRVESAIEVLSGNPHIDTNRVGLVGFSNAGFHSYYMITHPGKAHIAAAVIDDAFTAGYGEEITTEASGTGSNSWNVYGGTFWEKKDVWLKESSAFNVDRVRTPALFAIHHERQVSYPAILETIAAFAFNRRPLEYLVFPYAVHVLSMPQQRAASQQATIDWMKFWLTDRLPKDVDRAQYWQEMKRAWERQQSWEAAGNPVGSAPR